MSTTKSEYLRDGTLFDLSINYYEQFIDDRGNFDAKSALEHGYNQKQIPHIKAALESVGPLPRPVKHVEPVKFESHGHAEVIEEDDTDVKAPPTQPLAPIAEEKDDGTE